MKIDHNIIVTKIVTMNITPNKRLNEIASREFEPQSPMEVASVLEAWLEKFPKESKFLKSHSSYLDRKKVKTICQSKKYTLNQKFLLIMLWGYGSNGVGPSRTFEIINQENFKIEINKTYRLSRSGRHIDAIANLATNSIKGFGPAYGTKFVFFNSPWSRVCAPIYDKRVREWLQKYAKKDFDSTVLKKVQWNTNVYTQWSMWLQYQANSLDLNWWDLEYLIFDDSKKIRR